MTFKQEGQISSILKIRADFDENGIEITDYQCNVYFKDSTDAANIRNIMGKMVPMIDIETEFGLTGMLDEFNSTKATVKRECDTAMMELNPIQGFEGVVVNLSMKHE